MAKGISVHVGVSKVRALGINVPDLKGCENDAAAMHAIARDRGFVSEGPILNEAATFDRVTKAIRDAAGKLGDGDIFLFTFSGHGTRRGAEDIEETDFKDESIVLHDHILIDNVLRRYLWPQFGQGVRIVMVSDSCHSGTVFMAPAFMALAGAPADARPARPLSPRGPKIPADGGDAMVSTGGSLLRTISEFAARRHFELSEDFYGELRKSLPSGPAPELKASLLLLAACEEEEKTPDGEPHGVFTQALLDVLNGDSSKNYNELIKGIREKLLDRPQHAVLAPAGRPPEFVGQRAFSI